VLANPSAGRREEQAKFRVDISMWFGAGRAPR
jgi:hypothetical protein